MHLGLRLAIILAVCAAASACTLPRGAARPGEVLKVAAGDEPSFDVIAVTGDTLPGILSWPSRGRYAAMNWVSGGGGSGSLIRPGDAVDLVIWDSQENSLLAPETAKSVDISGLRVGSDGEIFVPYIEKVSVAGLSSDQARAKIQSGLAAIAPDAQVQLSVSAGTDSLVDLVSGVKSPGRFPLTDGRLTVLSLLAEGGGIDSAIQNPLVRLQRGGESYVISVEKLLKEPSRNVALRGGDRVVVEEDPRYFVSLGAAGSQRLVAFEKDEVSALDALSLIGGLTPTRANLKGVMVLRDYPESVLRYDGQGPSMPQTIFTFDLTRADGLFAARKFPIHSGDLVLATESPIPAANTVLALFGTTLGVAQRLDGL